MGCELCDLVHTGLDAAFRSRYPSIRNRLVYQGDGFVVTPTIGQLHPTHLLIVAREHVTSFFPHDVDILAKARKVLAGMGFGEGVYFEHGLTYSSAGSNCGVAHAHIHFIDVPLDRIRADFRRRTRATRLSLEEFATVSAAMPEYLYIATPRGTLWLAQENLESQLVRKIVASHLGVHWDWRAYNRQDSVAAILDGKDHRNSRRGTPSSKDGGFSQVSKNIQLPMAE